MRLLPHGAVALKLLILILTKQSQFEAQALTFCPRTFENSFYWNQKLYSSNEESFPYAKLGNYHTCEQISLSHNEIHMSTETKVLLQYVLFSMEVLINQKCKNIRNSSVTAISPY